MNNKWKLQMVCFIIVVFVLPITLETFNIIGLRISYLIILSGVVVFPIVCCELNEDNKDLWVFRNKNK